MKTITGITSPLNSIQLSQLDGFVLLYNKIQHQLYVDLFIKKLAIKDLSPVYQAKYSISKRHFDSIRKVLEGKVSSVLTLNKSHIVDTKGHIKLIEKDLLAQTKMLDAYKEKQKQVGQFNSVEKNFKKSLLIKISYNQKRLEQLKFKLKKLENINNTGNPRLCFGSNKLFRQQFLIKTSNSLTKFKNYQQWYESWFYSRNKEFTLIGSKDESAGNQSAQINHVKNNVFNLKININHKAENVSNKYINISFTLNHEVNTLINIIKNNQGKDKSLWQALTYRLIKQSEKSRHKEKYKVCISFEKHLVKKTYTRKDIGCVGVDINQEHLAISNLDSKGNLLNIFTYEYDCNGSQHQNKNSISLAIKKLMALGVQLNKPIVIEQLDFTAKKKTLRTGQNKRKNKQLSSFIYSKIIELLVARAEDNFIEVRVVNPAYTSIIGAIKYSRRNRIGGHHAAAMCIGRKGLFNIYNRNKKLVKEFKEKRISSKNIEMKSLNLPVRNNLSSVLYWNELKKMMIKLSQHEKKSRFQPTEFSTSWRNYPAKNASVEVLSEG